MNIESFLFQPVQYICDWIVKNGTPISTLKKDLLREVEKRAGLKIPYERLVNFSNFKTILI